MPTNIEPETAGYTDKGMDYNGHMHECHCGTFVSSEGRVGHYCAATLVNANICSDPRICEEVK